MTRLSGYILFAALLLVGLYPVMAQRRFAAPTDRNGVPTWDVDPAFADDVFTFVRVRYSSYGSWDRWKSDFPDSDLNFSYRLQQLTSLKVDPNGKILELTDPELFRYPFLYMIEPGTLIFN